MKVAVFGMGYVGTVTAALLAANGHEVRTVDVDPNKVAMINAGVSPVIEPGLAELVEKMVTEGRLSATSEGRVALDDADLSIICVGTPSLPTGGSDLQFVVRATAEIGAVLREQAGDRPRFHAILVRSTIPPRTTEELLVPALQESTDGTSVTVGVGMCPEFLREGSALADFSSSPLTVVGTEDQRVADAAAELFAFLDEPIRVVPPRVAESLKYACNAFHATKVSFANEMGRLLRRLGVDGREVMDLFCVDTKLNLSSAYLSPGFAFGGSCLPKDLRSLLYLARVNFLDLPLLSGTLLTNELSVREVVDRVVATDARTIAILGLSFKMTTDDLRESPYVELAETLIGKGFEVRIYDPIVEPANLVGSNLQAISARIPHLRGVLTVDPAVALDGADLALVSTSVPAVTSALGETPPRIVIDLSGRLGGRVEALPGYEGVAW
jgi:GDP-mannose 6-dehydrogenase